MALQCTWRGTDARRQLQTMVARERAFYAMDEARRGAELLRRYYAKDDAALAIQVRLRTARQSLATRSP